MNRTVRSNRIAHEGVYPVARCGSGRLREVSVNSPNEPAGLGRAALWPAPAPSLHLPKDAWTQQNI